VYSLDLATLLLMLQELSYTGQLEAHLSVHTQMLHGGKVILTIVQGRPTACIILNTHGHAIVKGEQAMQVAKSMGALEWHLAHTTNATTEIPAWSAPQYPQSSDTTRFHQTQTMPAQLPVPRQSSPTQTRSDQSLWPRTTNPLLPSVTIPLPRITGYQYSPVTNPSLPRMPHTQTRELPAAHNAQAHDLLQATCIPQRIVTINPQTLATLPRPLRRTLVLVDGKRPVSKIMTLLSPNATRMDEVLATLQELASRGLITLS
jgi:hypothetical protein